MVEKRVEWIDMAKGIGLLFVFLGHLKTPFLFTWIYTFHMPLFFFLSGLVYNHSRNYGNGITKRFTRLVIPYFTLGSGIFIVWCIIYAFQERSNAEYWYMLRDFLVQRGYWTIWFLAALFLASILQWGLVCIAKEKKTVRGSQDRINGRDAIHCLNAFVTEHHTVLRQIIGEKKESEITMLPEVIDSIDMKGATVTIDAMGCQTKIVKSIRKKKADYMIALKLNQPRAFQEVVELFEYIKKNNIQNGVDVWRDHDKGHGRIEDRSVISLDLTVYPLEELKKFSGIKCVVRVNSVVWRNSEQTQEIRYYITSQGLNARKHGGTIRAHWAIENKLHYVLDVVFDEDANRSRKDHLASNFTTIRKVCMNLLRSVKADKKTLKSTARKALMFPEFAFDLIRKSGILEGGTLA